jgi:hypothetical protein
MFIKDQNVSKDKYKLFLKLSMGMRIKQDQDMV